MNKSKDYNRVMVITGAASGLGKALALAAAQQGYDIAVADVQEQAGNQAVAAIKQHQVEAAYFHCDVGQAGGLLQLKDQVMAHFGRVDVLVNNAGVGSQGTVCDSTEEEWARQWQINLMGVVRGCQAFIPQLKKSADPAIVNVASFAAVALAPGVASYNVVKAGVLALSETLRCELAEAGIHVSVICPAFFKTNLVESMQNTDDKIKNQINRWMTKSKYTADDVANMILASIDNKQFMVLCDSTTQWQYRLSRWFPNYFFKQKVKMIKRMFQ
ncbi:SDR family NAD(P)-dependent oxidoreductase [Marinicella litoralis]|uniref:Short-subunit dehydrogenase n=1 Tax=Marinicella litoralis TaxID=644220 RepID=A0A4R6XRI2_9GAMM|nr:SDR family NAD(P)-dependent oxidoreductase [Marinicella litoralis]TDR22336.1 short-subunit dehydrogenase [Marinicella litoralis]